MNDHRLLSPGVPITPQDIDPEELKTMLAQAKERRSQAAAALEAAQDFFDAAERQHDHALTEEQKRVERELRFHMDFLRDLVPTLREDAARHQRTFEQECAEDAPSFDKIGQAFVLWSRARLLAHEARQAVMTYDSQQSRQPYIAWEFRVQGWNQLIRSVTSANDGGTLAGGDNVEGLRAVNERIVEESQAAPKPLQRYADDTAPVFLEDMGIRDPARSAAYMAGSKPLAGLDFSQEFSAAVSKAVSAATAEDMRDITAETRARFAEQAARTVAEASPEATS